MTCRATSSGCRASACPAPSHSPGHFVYAISLPNDPRRCMKLLLLSLLAVLLAACAPTPVPTSAPAGPSGKLVVAQTVDAQSMDPYQVNQVAGESVMKVLFDE